MDNPEYKVIKKGDEGESVIDYPDTEKYNKLRQEHQAEVERKEEELLRARHKEQMKKSAEQNKKAEAERRAAAAQKSKSGLNSIKAAEEEKLKKCKHATKKYLLEISREDNCPKEINPSAVEWPEGATRMVAQVVFRSKKVEAVCLNRKGISDEEGKALLIGLQHNKSVRKLELEGNSLEMDSLKELTKLVKGTDTLQYLSLEGNTKLYQNSTKEEYRKFIDAIRENESLLSVNLSYNSLLDDVLDDLIIMLEGAEGDVKSGKPRRPPNNTIINLQINGPLLSKDLKLRKIQHLVMLNQLEFQSERRREKEERRATMAEYERLMSIKALKDSNSLMETNAEEHRKEYIAMKEQEFQDDWHRRMEKWRRDTNKVQIEIAANRGKKKGKRKGGKKN